MPEAPSQKEKVTHQQYIDARTELNELMARKKLVDRNLAGLENSIYAFEGSYLEDTQHGGNIIRGFDGYINTKTDKSRVKYSESDRLFSMSSTTFAKALQIKENPEAAESSQDESKRTSSSRRPNPKLSNSGPNTITAAAPSPNNRRLMKQALNQTKNGDGTGQKPPKKMRLSSTGRDADGDEDLDV